MATTSATGLICHEPGIYRATCLCTTKIVTELKEGDVFPACHRCQEPVVWVLVQPTR